MQNYLKLDERSWSTKLMQFWRQYLWKSLHWNIDFSFFSNLQIYLFPLFFVWKFHFKIPTTRQFKCIVARLELIILPFWQRPAEIGEIISISCGEEGGSSALPPSPPRRSVAASAWRSQQGEVTWVRPEKISSIPSSNELQSLLRPSVHHRSAAAADAMPKRSAKIFIFVQ